MGIFGWSLPPGCSSRHIEEAFGGDDGPCDVCGNSVDDCICPECPECTTVGDPKCYEKHGLVRTQEQIDSKAAADKIQADAVASEDAYWSQYAEDLEAGKI